MAVTALPQTGPEPEAAAEPAGPSWLLQVGRWDRALFVMGALLVGLCLLEGWLYLRSYYAFFHIPTEGLDVALQEVFFQGAHSLLFPLIVAPVAFLLRVEARRVLLVGVLAVAACAAILAWVAGAFRWYSAMDILVQTAAVFWIGLTVLAVQRGSLRGGAQRRLVLAGAAVLLLVSMPTAFGTIDAGQKATARKTHLVLASTHELGLPDAIRNGNLVEYRKLVLLRESPSRYWVIRLGRAADVYSVAKNEVVYIRY